MSKDLGNDFGLGNSMNIEDTEEWVEEIVHSKDSKWIDDMGLECPVTVERWWVYNKLSVLFRNYLSHPKVIESIQTHQMGTWFGSCENNRDSNCMTTEVLLDLLNIVNEVLCSSDGYLPSEHHGYMDLGQLLDLKDKGMRPYKNMSDSDLEEKVTEYIISLQNDEDVIPSNDEIEIEGQS